MFEEETSSEIAGENTPVEETTEEENEETEATEDEE